MPTYRVIYFNARGRAEPIRQILEVGGADWEDVRFEHEDWHKFKPDMPFGQVPVLEYGEVQIAQSITICKFLAQMLGLAGGSLEEQARAEMIAYTLDDLRQPFRAIVLEKDLERKTELREKYEKEQLPNFLELFEKNLKENNGGNGYFVGEKMTFADIMFSCYMDKDVFENKVGISLDLSPYPKLAALKQRVDNHPKIKAWIRRRPKTPC